MRPPSVIVIVVNLIVVMQGGCGGTASSSADATPAAAVTTDTPQQDFGEIILDPATVMNGRLTVNLPRGFERMSQSMLEMKYPSESRPTVVFTNETGRVNIAMNHTADPVPPGGIPDVLDAMKRQFGTAYPTIRWNDTGMIEQGGRTWGRLDCVTPAIDTRIRNIMIVTSLDGRLLLVTFNTVEELESTWAGPGRAIIDSVRVVE